MLEQNKKKKNNFSISVFHFLELILDHSWYPVVNCSKNVWMFMHGVLAFLLLSYMCILHMGCLGCIYWNMFFAIPQRIFLCLLIFHRYTHLIYMLLDYLHFTKWIASHLFLHREKCFLEKQARGSQFSSTPTVSHCSSLHLHWETDVVMRWHFWGREKLSLFIPFPYLGYYSV